MNGAIFPVNTIETMNGTSYISGRNIQAEWIVPKRPRKSPARKWHDWLARVHTVWEAALNYVAPLGYEDETGFHYGDPPVPHNGNHRAPRSRRKAKSR
jgi:hypothetical protein